VLHGHRTDRRWDRLDGNHRPRRPGAGRNEPGVIVEAVVTAAIHEEVERRARDLVDQRVPGTMTSGGGARTTGGAGTAMFTPIWMSAALASPAESPSAMTARAATSEIVFFMDSSQLACVHDLYALAVRVEPLASGVLSQRPDPHQFPQEVPRRFPGDSQEPYHAVGLRCRTPQIASLRRGPRPYGILIFNSKIRFRRFSAPRAPRRSNEPAPTVGLVGRLDSSKSGSLPPAPRPFHGYELLPCLPMSLTRQTPSWMGLRTASSFSTGSIPFCSGRPSLRDPFRLTQR
jgi:hypothetical protein